jgi:excisionase family DNA binding protein
MPRRGRPKLAPVAVAPILLRPAEAAAAMGISRTKTYELIARREIPSVRIGGSVRVPVDALREFITRQTTSNGKSGGHE